jgi:hypothetical protein
VDTAALRNAATAEDQKSFACDAALQQTLRGEEASTALRFPVQNDGRALAALQQNAPWQTPLGALDLTKISTPVAALFAQCDNPVFNTARLKRQLKNYRGTAVFRLKSHSTNISPGKISNQYPLLLKSFFANPQVQLPALANAEYELR